MYDTLRTIVYINVRQIIIKHNTQILACDYFAKETITKGKFESPTYSHSIKL